MNAFSIHNNRRFKAELFAVVICFAVNVGATLSAATVTISWEGTISYVALFGADPPPLDVAIGAPISGSLAFEADQSILQQHILASHWSGEIYRYNGALTHLLTVANSNWSLLGGIVSLISYSQEPRKLITLDGNSDYSTYDSFPQYAGTFAAGLVFGDDTPPLDIFDDFQIENTTFNLAQLTAGNGYLTTQERDANGDIINGYYFTFDIQRATIPEPTSLSFIAISLVFLGVCSRHRTSPNNALQRL